MVLGRWLTPVYVLIARASLQESKALQQSLQCLGAVADLRFSLCDISAAILPVCGSQDSGL